MKKKCILITIIFTIYSCADSEENIPKIQQDKQGNFTITKLLLKINRIIC